MFFLLNFIFLFPVHLAETFMGVSDKIVCLEELVYYILNQRMLLQWENRFHTNSY